MIKKLNIFIFILFVAISIFIMLHFFGVINLIDLNSNKYIFVGFISISIAVTIIMLISIFRISSSQPKEIVKVVYKDVETKDESLSTSEIDNIKNQDDIIEKAMNLTNLILSDIRDETNIDTYCDKFLINFSKHFKIVQGIFYIFDKADEKFKTKGTYAYYSEDVFREFELGVGLTGQVAKNKKILTINNVPSQYIKILSGLGSGSPSYLTLLPIIHDDVTLGVVEIASFEKLSDELENLFVYVSLEIGSDLSKFIN